MQDPNEDTEWNDLLRKKGILPQKEPEITEEALAEMIDKTIEEKNSTENRLGNLNLDQLDELEDDEDEEIIRHYREKRLAELKAQVASNKFGEVEEISGQDYVEKVNKAGDGIWVFLHLYKQGIPQCKLINEYFIQLSRKFPQVKFLKSISTTCVPNYPDSNLPTIFVYYEGQMKKQFVGHYELGGDRLKYDELEWMLSKTGAFKTDLEEDPRGPAVKDVFMSSLNKNKTRNESDSDDDNDW